MKCPVCENQNDSCVCRECGFDSSCDYENFRTFSLLNNEARSVSDYKKTFIKSSGAFEKLLFESKKMIDSYEALLNENKRLYNELLKYRAYFKSEETAKNKAGTAGSVNIKDSASDTVNVGDIITLGKYQQSIVSNKKDDIEWIVLAKENGRALLISRYALDCQQYNKSMRKVTWDLCTLRDWLYYEFYEKSFTPTEQIRICLSTVKSEKNPSYFALLDNDTSVKDKVFLLSISEAKKYFDSDEARMCMPTEYAVSKGAYQARNINCCWWLRTPGNSMRSASYINADGCIGDFGHSVNHDGNAIRPALWINL